MEPALRLKAVLAEEMSVIGGENNDRILDSPSSSSLSRIADIFIHHADHAIIHGDQLLLVILR